MRLYFGKVILSRAWIRNARITDNDYFLKTDKTGDRAIVNIGSRMPRFGLIGKLCDVRITQYIQHDGKRLYAADARNIREA